MKPGLKLHQGHPVGRDPRQMTRDELGEAGHQPMSPLQAIRAHCLDCCGYQEKEVAHCTAVNCPAWPYRMGTDPWRKPASPARREAARRTMANLNARRRKGDGAETSASPSEDATAPFSTAGSGVAPTGLPGGWISPARRNGPGRTEAAMVGPVTNSGMGQSRTLAA
jgi:hypothetical protein